jgi:hypothetical protein
VAEWIEYVDSFGANVQAQADSAQRQFKVWNTGRASFANPASITNSSGLALPGHNDPHPDFPNLRLDSYSLTTNGSLINATALYSNNGRFRAQPKPQQPTAGTPALFEASFQTVTETAPIAKKVTVSIPDGSGSYESVSGWNLSEFTHSYALARVYYKVRFTATQFATAVEAVRTQINKIHLIGGKFYRFEGDDIRAVSATEYETRYGWVYDSGTRTGTGTTSDSTVLFPSSLIGFIGSGVWLRPPFHRIIAVRGATVEDPPTFRAVMPYDYAPDGWQSLPGMNL